eukprot:1177114-Prorocentrum_minimum.AAC.3
MDEMMAHAKQLKHRGDAAEKKSLPAARHYLLSAALFMRCLGTSTGEHHVLPMSEVGGGGGGGGGADLESGANLWSNRGPSRIQRQGGDRLHHQSKGKKHKTPPGPVTHWGVNNKHALAG